ncbi:hypothetical protein GCM10023231_09170 [Olivibacter ginsenosidimutans]|uniref:Caa(3)-type oxidase n=1 Tax=Olivibacter ginsenosidimutans TaxID=1176537 RepID=A0ABP9APK6_9SPHI
MSEHHTSVEHGQEEHHADMSKKLIWKVFFYLLAITCLEFFIALVLVYNGPLEKGPLVNFIYVVLTLVKAYFIVAYFMHLKFEKMGFIISTLIVFVFIIYFIILLLTEGSYLHTHLHHMFS